MGWEQKRPPAGAVDRRPCDDMCLDRLQTSRAKPDPITSGVLDGVHGRIGGLNGGVSVDPRLWPDHGDIKAGG